MDSSTATLAPDALEERQHQAKCARLRIFLQLGIAGTALFALRALFHHSFGFAATLLISCLGMAWARLVLRDPKKLRAAAHLKLASLCLLAGVNQLWDGQRQSLILWLVPFVPMVASYSLDPKAARRYTYGSILIVLASAIIAEFWQFENSFPDSDARWMLVRFASLLLFTTFGFVSLGSSLRMQRELARESLRLQEQEESANVAEHSKSAFLANLSNELQMPMKGMLALAQRAAQRGEQQGDQTHRSKILLHCARLSSLLDAVLDLARLESGELDIRAQEFSLAKLVEGVYTQQANRAAQKGLSLRCVQQCAPLRYRGDPERVRQILSALLDNAIRFSERGQVEIELLRDPPQAGDGPREHRLQIIVRDEGVGIAKEKLARIFGRFESFQADSAEGPESIGLSLAIAHRLALRMDGSLDLQSTPGEGTQFTLRLPLSLAQAPLLELEDFDDLVVEGESSAESDEVYEVQSEEQAQRLNTLLPLVSASLPMICVFAIISLQAGHQLLAIVHLVALLAMGFAIHRRPQGHSHRIESVSFLSALGLSVVAQSMVDGGIRSEALWALPLFCIVCAYLLGRPAAWAATALSALMIGGGASYLSKISGLAMIPDSSWSVAAVRLSSLVAFATIAQTLISGIKHTIQLSYAQQLQQQETLKLAVRSDEEKSRFLSKISKEIRVPLEQIKAGAKAMIREESSGEQRELAGTIFRSASNMDELFEDVLAKAGASEQTSAAQQRTFKLSELVRDTQRLFTPCTDDNHIVMHTQSLELNTWVQGYASRIFQILCCLLSNALSYGQDGGIEINLRQLSRAGDKDSKRPIRFLIEVVDRGPGISASRLSELLHTPLNGEYGDKGGGQHGLMMARALAQRIGGKIHARSEVGQGSTFSLELTLPSAEPDSPLMKEQAA